MPRLYGSRRTIAPFAAATSAVRSLEPSSITTTSSPGSNARNSSITRGTVCSSFSAGTMATRRSSPSPARAGAAAVSSAVSGTRSRRDAEVEQLQQPPCAVRIRVLVEHAHARAPAELLRLRRIREQVAVRVGRLVCVGNDDQLAAGLEPPVDPL